MKQDFCVTIKSRVAADDIKTCTDFPFAHLIDLRQDENGKAKGVEECLLRKLQNFWIGYQQLPTDLRRANSRAQNVLMRAITDQRFGVLVLTDDIAGMAEFCQDLDIPCRLDGPQAVEVANTRKHVSRSRKTRLIEEVGERLSA